MRKQGTCNISDAADAERPSDAAIHPRAATQRWPDAHCTLLKLHRPGLPAVQPQVAGGHYYSDALPHFFQRFVRCLTIGAPGAASVTMYRRERLRTTTWRQIAWTAGLEPFAELLFIIASHAFTFFFQTDWSGRHRQFYGNLLYEETTAFSGDSAGEAIRRTREHLSVLFDGGARIELRSSTDSGCEVVMEIPG